MKKLKKINFIGNDAGPHRLGQAICFAFAEVENDTLTILHNFTSCKDYLTDSLVFTEEMPDPIQYGGYWSFRGPIDVKNTTLVIGNPAFLKDNLHLFQEYEKSLGIKPLRFWEIKPSTSISYGPLVVVKADEFWQTTTIHLSLFMSWMRHLTKHGLVSLDDPNGLERYIVDWFPMVLSLPKALQKLKVTIKRNAPNQRSMHSLNGHHSALSLPPRARARLTYDDQLRVIAPELFSPTENTPNFTTFTTVEGTTE